MIFYKILSEDKFVGVGTEAELRKHQKKHNIILGCLPEDAEFIECDRLYHDSRWMRKPQDDTAPYEEALVCSIEEEEYNQLAKAIENNEEIVIAKEADEDVEVVEEVLVPAEELTVDFVREVKLKEMSLACGKAIKEGFTIWLSDGLEHHFSLTLQDQANLAAAQMQILAGDSAVDYHADGEEYKVFSADDMVTVIESANQHRMYHLAYYNSMKTWINSLVRIKNIQDIKYGDEIPKKYQSALLKRISG